MQAGGERVTARHLSVVPNRPRPPVARGLWRLAGLVVRAAPTVLHVVLLVGLAAAGTAVGLGLYDGDNVLVVAGVCGAVGWSGFALWLLVFDPKPGEER